MGPTSVFCPELPGCASAGYTEAEGVENIKEAIALYLEPSPFNMGPQGKVFEVEISACGRRRRLGKWSGIDYNVGVIP